MPEVYNPSNNIDRECGHVCIRMYVHMCCDSASQSNHLFSSIMTKVQLHIRTCVSACTGVCPHTYYTFYIRTYVHVSVCTHVSMILL